jgi:hypothetical protein
MLVMARDMDEALTVIGNWRTSHIYPLQAFKNTLTNRARAVDSEAIVARRLKRLTSIQAKLRRNPHMQLSQMQDIGGCRAVVRSSRAVYAVVKKYRDAKSKKPKAGPELHREYDYILNPKPDGYRSFHLVYKYRSTASELECFNGHRIEIQIRSRLQHAWATAVETVDAFTGQALKSNFGRPEWARFFTLMGSAIALRERRPLVPNTPTTKLALAEELREIESQLRAWEVLHGLIGAAQFVGASPKNADAVLLELDVNKMTISATGFTQAQLPEASAAYLATEKRITSHPGVQAVLVSLDEIDNLRKAFPNYYADTHVFLDALVQAVALDK